MDVISIPVKNYSIASIGILNCEFSVNFYILTFMATTRTLFFYAYFNVVLKSHFKLSFN